MDYWGKELIIDCKHCDIAAITNKEHVENFARELVKRIDMVAFGEPQVVHFGDGNKAGFTLVQLIMTSNITGHFCNDNGNAYLNVFSCKDFNESDVYDVIDEFFHPEKTHGWTLWRDASSI